MTSVEGLKQTAARTVPHLRQNLSAMLQDIWTSPPMESLAATLATLSLKIGREPLLSKTLEGGFLRVMWPVSGGLIEAGTVVSLVCLHDPATRQTLYAHPMHAGPDANPLMVHLHGSLATPRAQPGLDGERATLRLLQHKRALWSRFLRERQTLGHATASQRWRRGYFWALHRLYFCSRCFPCHWGSPFFDGKDPLGPRQELFLRPEPAPRPLDQEQQELVQALQQSSAWKVETAYARRGGFSVWRSPRLIRRGVGDCSQVLFPTNAAILQAGSLVGLWMVYHHPSRKVLFAHCLSAGPTPEPSLVAGDLALGLPPLESQAAGAGAANAYLAARRKAWCQFWIDELEEGLAQASSRWLRAFWQDLEQLFGGNDLARPLKPEQDPMSSC